MYQKHFNSKMTHGGTRKPNTFRGRGPSRFSRGRMGRGGGFRGDHIDASRFINKAVITEEIDRFVPEHSFADFQVDNRLKQTIAAKGYIEPTPIQDRTIPYIIKGTDIVGIANTGTGKTGAFLIPLINKVILGKQLTELRRSHNFIIGTPGRLKDLIKRGKILLSQFRTIVLDEADRMLDMGFVGDMKNIVSLMPTPKHTLFFSATLSVDIEKLIKDFCKEPVRISVKTGDTARNIDQDVVRVSGNSGKIDVLHGLLKEKDFSKVLIFARTKHGAERLSKDLAKRGFKSESIHGNKTHSSRQKALGLFKNSHIQILVATDVAARGLDIADVSHVINYDLPATYNDYVHRIGRTGRGDKRGKALTFIS